MQIESDVSFIVKMERMLFRKYRSIEENHDIQHIISMRNTGNGLLPLLFN